MTTPAGKVQQAVAPGLLQALVCFLGILAIISCGLFLIGVDLHSLLFVCLFWTGCHVIWLGHSANDLRSMMSVAISRALPALYIFMLIGLVIAAFMHSGTIASLMYFGLGWLSPTLFLPIGLVLCAIMSLATGTAWGTAGTLGLVFMGIGSSLGLPPALTAGMVVCGATFGDKMSAVSDTTNLAAMSAGTSLYRHIYSMLFTTVPTFVFTLLVFTWLGASNDGSVSAAVDVDALRTGLSASYRLTPWITLLPLALLFVLSVRRVPAEITMSLSIFVAVLIACLYQGTDLALVLNALWQNQPGQTGVGNLDELLGRGGLASMSWTLLLALQALALGGLLHGARILDRLLQDIITRVRRTGSLVASTIVAGVMGNFAMGEAYITIILNCQLFGKKYAEAGLDAAVLSRSVEEGSTLTTGLIPWTTAGAFYSATLGVAVLDYLPYALFNYMNGIVAIAMASLGWGLLRPRESDSQSQADQVVDKPQ